MKNPNVYPHAYDVYNDSIDYCEGIDLLTLVAKDFMCAALANPEIYKVSSATTKTIIRDSFNVAEQFLKEREIRLNKQS